MFFLVVLLFCCFCNNVLAYDMNTTHPELTKLIIDKYNTQTSKYKIDEGFNAWIVKGSIDEDLGTRSLNHFFDPIYNRT